MRGRAGPLAAPSVSSASVAACEQGFQIYGVRVALGAPDQDLMDRLVALLPPGISPCEAGPDDPWFVLVDVGGGMWSYRTPRGPKPMFGDVALVLGMIDTELRHYVADNATDVFFIHAGAVALDGRAIVIPGDSFSGKTRLVAELVRAGAEYYSDEYAVLDHKGLVHPYARPLSIRKPPPHQNDRSPAESLGGAVGSTPVPVGVIASTAYRPEATFRPERRSRAQGVLTLLAHSARAHEHAEATLAAVRNAASTALVLEGDRGEASVAAELLLDTVSGTATRAAAEGR